MRILDIRLAMAVALAAASSPVGAQESTSATYGDWVVRCERDAAVPTKKTCQMAPFDHCLPAGCFAEFELKEDMLKRLRAAEGAGKVTFKDASGHDIVVPISFKGSREAFDALAKTGD